MFDRLLASDPSGATWLPRLLLLGSRARAAELKPSTARLVEGHGTTWGRDELALAAPLALLEYLVENVTAEQVAASGDTGIVLRKRQALASHDPETVEEALAALRAGRRGRQWYVLEGASRPDVTLEMPDAVLVIEGKRTERSCTSKTKWMQARSQLVRHMDAAMERYPAKRVLGLLIVEGGGPDALVPSTYWLEQSEAQHSPQMLAASLPHRRPEERETVAEGILGVATWQSLCAACAIPWPPRAGGDRRTD